MRTATPVSSPEYLRLSLAAAMVLGAQPGRFYRDVQLRCINLLLVYPDGCRANCAYCGLARTRPGHYQERSFIRVDWPTLSTEEILHRLGRYQHDIARVCLSMVVHPRAYADTLVLAQLITQRTDAPLSVLIAPNLFDRERLGKLRQAGADMIGVGLDAASQRVFERTRGRIAPGLLHWHQYWQTIEGAREVFGPWKVNCHLVVGIGETDSELVETLYRLKEMQVYAYLFSFYPEAGSLMARRRRPSLWRWRRLQLAKHLIDQDQLSPEQTAFDDEGRLVGLAVSPLRLEDTLRQGQTFMTHGCPDQQGQLVCSRPFGSYRPGESFRDFPFPPEEDDLRQVRKELHLGELLFPRKGQLRESPSY